MKQKNFKIVGTTMFTLGVMGLLVAIVVNCIALFVYDKSSAQAFTSEWWSAWFPSYIVWFVFLCIGATQKMFCNTANSE